MDIKLIEVTRDSTTGRYGNNAVITNITAILYSEGITTIHHRR